MNDVVAEESVCTEPTAVESLEARLAEARAEIASLKEQITQSQRLATIGTISAVVAHEFNNLLTPVISYAQYALTSAESDKPDMALIRKALSKSYQGATKAGKVCASMLGLVRGESEQAVVTVQSLIEETLAVMARDPKKDGIALRIQVQPDLAVRGDPVQLEQVLLNLLINARQAMNGKQGAITIKASIDEDDRVKLQVIDTGAGIDPLHLPRVFDPFFTTKTAPRRGEPRGTGLGLAICREIVGNHNGVIDVASEVGKGTTFTLTLPLAA